MAKLPTQYREQLAKAESAKKQVLHLLQWTDEQYAKFQYKTGCAYLQSFIPRDPQGIDILIESRLFWNWWKNHWAIRDTIYLAKNLDGMDTAGKTALYRVLHSAEDLAEEIHPNAVVLRASYAEMIGELIDNKKA